MTPYTSISPTTSAVIVQCRDPPGGPASHQLNVRITPTPAARKPRNVAGRLETRRVTGSVDGGPARDLGAGLVEIALPEIDVRGLLHLPIAIPSEIDDDDVPVPE